MLLAVLAMNVSIRFDQLFSGRLASYAYTVLGGGAGAVVVCVAVNELTIMVVLPKFN